MVGIEGITYAGNHGLEILHSDGSKFVHPLPIQYEVKVSDLLKALQESVKQTNFHMKNRINRLLNILYSKCSGLQRWSLG